MDPIYNTIGTNYNNTRQADPYITDRLFHFLNPQPGGRYLDIGCGTGNYTCALALKVLDFTGVEPSETMLIEARSKSNKINWLQGTAEQIPATNDTFNGVIATLTIHHWRDLALAFKEISRVTADDAKVVIFTATPQQMAGYWLNHYFPQMMQAAMAQMPSFQKINDALIRAGFSVTSIEQYDIQENLQDLFLYSGKNNPRSYLEDRVRNNISSFAALAYINEVKIGLNTLSADIEGGRFEEIKNSYENELGDYLFIVAEKEG